MHRPKDSNKYNFGHVLIVGGSPGMVGAPLLVGKAALRVGAGLVTVASDERTATCLDKRVEEIMTLTLPSYDKPGAVVEKLAAFAAEHKVTVLVVGPGLKENAAPFVRLLAEQLKLPLVLDAGGLAAFQSHLPQLQKITQHNNAVVITPHSGEYAKLTGQPSLQATQFAINYNLTVVLKGHSTVVAHPNGAEWRNNTGNPGMATAGTGDVLSGVIAGLLAQAVEPAQAAELGVCIHGLAGDIAAGVKTQPGMIASDIIDFLPEALKQLEHSR